jgi:glycosyltransferase involved in cell wall biosynthesis
MPGCRECVIDGISGYLVPVKDVSALAEKMLVLVNQPELRVNMGIAGRKKAEEELLIKNSNFH